jgi:hypothetical protein
MENNFIKFAEKTLKEITLWAWAAAILPLAALAGIFFVWAFGDESLLDIAMIIGGTTMFSIAVAWWWWALRAISVLIKQWKYSGKSLEEILRDIREVKNIIKGAIVEPGTSDRKRRESEDN